MMRSFFFSLWRKKKRELADPPGSPPGGDSGVTCPEESRSRRSQRDPAGVGTPSGAGGGGCVQVVQGVAAHAVANRLDADDNKLK